MPTSMFTSKRIVLFIVYSSVLVFLGAIILLYVSDTVTINNYKYKIVPYDHSIDSLFHPVIFDKVKFKPFYKSVESGMIYYATIGNSNIVILKAVNFQNINLENIKITRTDKIKRSQMKTYFNIIDEGFPVVQQVLNPKKSSFIKVLITRNSEVNREFGNNKFHYLSGNYGSIVFGNSQNCCIISFLEKRNNEVLILKSGNKLYFLFQTTINDDLMKSVNPDLL